MLRSLLFISAFSLGLTQGVLAQSASLIKSFNSWHVYSNSNKDTCFAVTNSFNNKGKLSLFRQIFPGEKDIFFVVDNDSGYPPGQYFLMEVGKVKYQFWSPKKEFEGSIFNSQNNTASLDIALSKANSAKLIARNKDNSSLKASFSLMGYTAAANFMAQYCGAKPLNVNITSNNKRCTVNSPAYCSSPQICEMAKSFVSIANYAKRNNYNCEKEKIISSKKEKKECTAITPSFCSSSQICEMAKSSYLMAGYAKRNNYNCEKEKVVSSSSNNKRCTVNSPAYCSSPQICEMAKSFVSIANYAKRNNYNCGISERKIVSKSKSCSESPELCTVAQLCKNATKVDNGKKIWRTDYASQKFIRIAKNNGLTCKVEEKLTKDENQKMVPASSGSGFFVSREGHIITNEHVIEKCRQVFLHRKGEEPVQTVVLARDVGNDLALLKAKVKPKVIFPISNDSPYLTQDVTAAGYPMISTLGPEVKVTKGIVSALSAPEDFSRIQVDAAVQPGNSGGPIFDEFGNVLGVVVSGFSDMQNVNFGIKASVVKNLLVANMVETLKPRQSTVNWRSFSSEVGDGTVLLSCWMTKSELAHLRKNNDKNRLLFDD